MDNFFKQKVLGAPNFRYYEFFKSHTAKRLRINNYTKNPKIIFNIELLATFVLQPIRDHFGPIKVLSGYRCPELNKAIGGSPTSNHILGQAADIEPFDKDISLIDIIEFISRNLQFRNCILEYPPGGWIHIDYRENDNLNLIKLKDENHNYEQVTCEYLREKFGNE